MADNYANSGKRPKGLTPMRRLAKQQGGRIPGVGWGVNLGINLSFGGTVWDPDISMRMDEEFYDRVEKDEVVAHAMMELRTLVAGRGYTINPRTPADEWAVPYFEAFLEHIEGYQAAKVNLCYAPIRGTHAARIVGSQHKKYQLVPGDEPRDWYMFDRLIDRDKRGLRIEYEAIDDSEPDSEDNRRYYYTVLDPVNGQWYRLRREDYVIWAYNMVQTSALMGQGLAHALFVPVYTRGQLRDIQLQAYDAYGTGIKVISIDPEYGIDYDTDADSNYQSPDDRAEDLVGQASALSERGHVIAHNKMDDFDIKWAQPGMFEALQRSIEHYEQNIRILILGSNVTGENGADGSRARAETQTKVGDRKIQTYRAELDAVQQDQLLHRWWAANWFTWWEMGKWQERCPVTIQTDRWVDYDPVLEAQVIEKMSTMGLELSVRQIRERTGYEKPKDANDAFRATPMPGQEAPGSGGDGPPVGVPQEALA